MRNFMRAIRPFLGALSRASLYIAGVGMVAMTLIVGWQVFARYILNDSPSWSEPLSLHLMSWFIMLGAAVGVRESVHLGLDILRYMMPPRIQAAMDLTSLALIFFSGLACAGTEPSSLPEHGRRRSLFLDGRAAWISSR